MKLENKIYKILKSQEIDVVISCPSISIVNLIELIEDKQEIAHIPVVGEDESIAIASGVFIGGKIPLVILNQTGIGSIMGTFELFSKYYKIPLILIICPDSTFNNHLNSDYNYQDHFLDENFAKKWEIKTLKEVNIIKDALVFFKKEKRPVAILLKNDIWR